MAKNKKSVEEFFDNEDQEKTINADEMLHKNMKIYGLDVIEDRALSDFRDGLKPAQRRLMWTANDLKATWNNKTVKSARITGDCFTGDTEIMTVNNEKLRIADLEQKINNNENVYTFSCSEKGEIVVSKVTKCWKKTDTTNIVRVHLDNNTYFECTPDHKIMTRDGSYTKAEDLKENTSLMPLYFGEETKDGRRQIINNTNDLTYKAATTNPIYSYLFDNYNHKVTKVEHLELTEPVAVYNVEVDSEYHNFPLGNGVFVKNCMGKYHAHRHGIWFFGYTCNK